MLPGRRERGRRGTAGGERTLKRGGIYTSCLLESQWIRDQEHPFAWLRGSGRLWCHLSMVFFIFSRFQLRPNFRSTILSTLSLSRRLRRIFSSTRRISGVKESFTLIWKLYIYLYSSKSFFCSTKRKRDWHQPLGTSKLICLLITCVISDWKVTTDFEWPLMNRSMRFSDRTLLIY